MKKLGMPNMRRDLVKLTTNPVYKIDHKIGPFPGKRSSAYKID
jgi:hypothetical protein